MCATRTCRSVTVSRSTSDRVGLELLRFRGRIILHATDCWIDHLLSRTRRVRCSRWPSGGGCGCRRPRSSRRRLPWPRPGSPSGCGGSARSRGWRRRLRGRVLPRGGTVPAAGDPPDLGPDPGRAVRAAARGVGQRDPGDEPGIGLPARGGCPAAPGPEAARGDAEQAAHAPDGMAGPLTLDEPIRAQARRLVSRARKAEACTRISRSSSSRTRTLRRRATTSVCSSSALRSRGLAWASYCSTQRRIVSWLTPRSAPTERSVAPGCRARRTASSRNSREKRVVSRPWGHLQGPRHTIGCPRNRVKSTARWPVQRRFVDGESRCDPRTATLRSPATR